MSVVSLYVDGDLVTTHYIVTNPGNHTTPVGLDALKEERDWWKEQAYGASDWVDALSNVRCARTCLSLKSTQRGYE